MSTYAIGDVQGCYAELQLLLEKIDFNEQQDELWFLGDLINRGPDNLAVLNLVRRLPNTSVVLGNHDLHYLAVEAGVRGQSRSDTLNDLLESGEREEITHWLRQQPLFLLPDNFPVALVHAGVPPVWSLKQAKKLANEVAEILKSDNYTQFLENMYGNEPNRWDESLTGWERIRLITNYLTRLRFCKADGTLDLITKTDVAPKGYSAWFDLRKKDKRQILFGHWAALEGQTNRPGYLALDTGCVWGRELTAYRLDDQRYFSVSALNPR